MANRRIDPRRIKTHFPYTIEEAADALGVHKNTVRMWIKGGLAVADDRRPTVMSGGAIRAYLENRLKARKSPLKPGEFYCFRCREPKSPAGGMADFVAASGGLGTLTGLCPDCETIMHRRASKPILNRDSGKGKDPMAKSKTPNERIKRAYIDFLRQAMGRSEASLEAVAAALHRFESYTRFRDFHDFHIEQAKAFKSDLAKESNAWTGEKLSAATITSILGTLKAFFRWLAGQPGYKSRIDASDAEYFNPPANQARVATARREQRIPTVEQILHVLATMPAKTAIEKRDRAVIAFTLLTGARDGATASFKLKHIDMVAGKVDQDAREVATKRAKTFPTYFFPVGDEIRAIVVEWVDFLRHKQLWGDDDPLFPATEVGIGETGRFGPVGLARRHWSNATAIRKIFKEAFTAAGLPRANPHSFRNTLVQIAYQLQLAPEEFKVWSQNLGHESILTTFSSYGPVTAYRQAEIMRRIATSGVEGAKPEEILSQIVALASRKNG